MDKEKIEKLCEDLKIADRHEQALFKMGYTLGFLDGTLDEMGRRIRPASSIPDAETR